MEECVKPSDAFIDSILLETFTGVIPRQFVNWAATLIGMPAKYTVGHPMTPKSLWVLYEGCKKYKENKDEDSD
jgi:hypothetical protein